MVGKIENSAKDSSVSMPLVPRSMTRDSPPVLRSRWKRSDRVWTWAKVETATSRIAWYCTLAKTPSRSWAKNCIRMRDTA